MGPGAKCAIAHKAGTTMTSDRLSIELRPPIQRAFLQQRISDIRRFFLFQPFTFLECQAVRPMRGPCRLQVRQVWLPWRSVNQIRFWIFSRLGVWPTHAWFEALQRMTKTPAKVFRSL